MASTIAAMFYACDYSTKPNMACEPLLVAVKEGLRKLDAVLQAEAEEAKKQEAESAEAAEQAEVLPARQAKRRRHGNEKDISIVQETAGCSRFWPCPPASLP